MQKQIKVVHITTIDEGGAYKAVKRIQDSLRNEGVCSNILLRTKLNKISDDITFTDNPAKMIISKGKNLINMFFGNGMISRDLIGTDISQNGFVREADVIFLHWINSFLSYRTIEKILQLEKPVIWVMHDTWIFTGGCHVNLSCERYRIGCGKCPLIKSDRDKDISYLNYIDKVNIFQKYRFTVVGPSNWIVETAKESKVLSGQNIICIPNCYNEKIFYKRPKKEALRKKYNINTQKHIILFGAAFDGTENKFKGFSYLLEALEKLSSTEYYLMIFGHADEKTCKNLKQEYKLLGYISDEQTLAEIYNIADVYVTPSLQESFGLTVCESMACGTPVVAFPVGGIKDQIIHKENGYLAKIRDTQDIAEGIQYCISNRNQLSEDIQYSANRFSSKRVGQRYVKEVENVMLQNERKYLR